MWWMFWFRLVIRGSLFDFYLLFQVFWNSLFNIHRITTKYSYFIVPMYIFVNVGVGKTFKLGRVFF